jgi:hypothetical protein
MRASDREWPLERRWCVWRGAGEQCLDEPTHPLTYSPLWGSLTRRPMRGTTTAAAALSADSVMGVDVSVCFARSS